MPHYSFQNSFSRIGFIAQFLDFLAVFAGGWLSYQLRFWEAGGWVSLGAQEQLMVLGLALFCAFFLGRMDLIFPGGQALAQIAGRVVGAWVVAWTVLTVLLVMTKTAELVSRIWLVSWLVTTVFTLWSGRLLAWFIVTRLHRAGYQRKAVLIYGDPALMRSVIDRIEQAVGSGFAVAGTVAPGDGQDIERVDNRLRPHEIWICVELSDHAQMDAILCKLKHSVANIRVLPDLRMYQLLNQGMSITVGIPMVNVSVSPIFGGRQAMKVLLDYGVASLALVLLSPLMAVIAIAIKLTSSGPVLFRQKRHGWNGQEIWVHKFRSMVVHQEVYGSLTQATRHDARVTAVGNFLRKTSLDELPQFFNVLQGKMSVVGPRPHALRHNDTYLKLIPRYALRHKVKPGITGWAQVCGFRGETDTVDKMEGRLRHDIYYLEHWSLWLDLKIIALTPLATMQNKNVY